MGPDKDRLIQRIRDGVIGRDAAITTPFGRRPVVYADYTASGRALDVIEDTLRDEVLPFYANTHSESSFCGAFTTRLREQARQQIHTAVGGGEDDKVIFCGSGATEAINRLIDIMNLRLPRDLDRRYQLQSQIPPQQRPVVFIGPYEHHSNELPWRESIADVVPIPLTEDGTICTNTLHRRLQEYSDRPLRIGSFSAASNVTGVRSDVAGITRLLKAQGALAFWDYAAAAPYVAIDMNPADGAALDAVFISPHKFVGGPGTPGVLVAKAACLENSVPARVGGGTVAFVSPDSHRYVDDPVRREEGGTPAIVESIRAGLVFRLQSDVGTETIETLERERADRVQRALGADSNIEVLGGSAGPRLPIFSLRFVRDRRELHYGFVVALLNDLFGIQARGGCSCAGPYGHTLLGLDRTTSRALDQSVQAGRLALRPGWVRLNFNYFIDDDELDYLLAAIQLVAALGHRLLPAYRLNVQSGLWQHRHAAVPPSIDLNSLDLWRDEEQQPAAAQADYAALLDTARAILQRGASVEQQRAAQAEVGEYEVLGPLRWFLSAAEAVGLMNDSLLTANA